MAMVFGVQTVYSCKKVRLGKCVLRIYMCVCVCFSHNYENQTIDNRGKIHVNDKHI